MPKRCPGRSQRMRCIFARKKIGEAAGLNKDSKCLFCDPERMAESCHTVKGRRHVTESLKAFRAHYETPQPCVQRGNDAGPRRVAPEVS